jgi:hypothetical protein
VCIDNLQANTLADTTQKLIIQKNKWNKKFKKSNISTQNHKP